MHGHRNDLGYFIFMVGLIAFIAWLFLKIAGIIT